MADRKRPGSSGAAARGPVGAGVAEAFALLGDETRLAILLALWEAYEPLEEHTRSFSELFERVDYDDRGNFNYHLGKLVGTFVRKVPEGGYALTDPGLRIVQAVIGGIDVDAAAFPPTEIDQPCQLCGAPTAVGYRERHVVWRCTDCSGIVPAGDELEGFLGAVKLEPAGVAARSPEAVKAATQVALVHREGSFFDGLCPTCAGPVDRALDVCPDHEPEGVCEVCNRRFSTRAVFRCQTCKDHTTTSLLAVALVHPAVVAFFENHGVSMRVRADDLADGRSIEALVDDLEMAVQSVDPARVAVAASVAGDRIRLTFDETVSVVDLARPERPDR